MSHACVSSAYVGVRLQTTRRGDGKVRRVIYPLFPGDQIISGVEQLAAAELGGGRKRSDGYPALLAGVVMAISVIDNHDD